MKKLVTQFVDLPDARIAYCEHGTGPTLILLHGNSESKHIFAGYQTDCFSMFRTIAVDSRGHGESRSNDTELTFDKLSDDMIDLCRLIEVKEAYVIGYSDGGNIALMLAKKAPELFTKIAAISPNYLVSGTEEKTLRSFQNIRKVLVFLNRLGFMKKERMRFDLMMHDIGITEAELKGIRTKMKILYAEQDMVKEDHILRMAELIPGASLNKIPSCTHLNIMGKPEAVEIMRSWFLEKEAAAAVRPFPMNAYE